MATRKIAEDTTHIESTDEGLDHLKNVGLHDSTLANGALEGTVQEHGMGVFRALKTYKRAALWSMCKGPSRMGAFRCSRR